MLPLFEDPSPGFRAGLAQALGRLAAENVLIGTSSWKYEGWLGQVYSAGRYLSHGNFSQKRFQNECLAEYAETFPVVCGDFSFYQFPSADYWKRLFNSAPEGLRFALKVPEEITRKTFPTHERYGARAGVGNESFLNAGMLNAMFLEPLRPYEHRIPVLMFEFGAFSRVDYGHLREFVGDLDRFFGAIPRDFRYAVEVRNPHLLADEYFDCLRSHGVPHVFNAWTHMPELSAQIEMPRSFAGDFTVCRALLRRGRPYAEAVKKFSPYERVLEPNPGTREAVRALIGRARANRQPAYIFVNNRLEGNAPGTIWGIVGES
jgi:uncharacterized protein YecE (DUF72 family)